MKKLYRKGKVHPTSSLISDHLSFLPAAILTLTISLSPEDKEVLAYLISSSSTNYSGNPTVAGAAFSGGNRSRSDHPASFNCSCFRCYMSYWVKWDSSPNRQLIHEIIDAFEEDSLMKNKKEKNKKERKKKDGSTGSGELKRVEKSSGHDDGVLSKSASVEEGSSFSGGVGGGGGGEEEGEKGSLRRFVNFVGEKIWGVWN